MKIAQSKSTWANEELPLWMKDLWSVMDKKPEGSLPVSEMVDQDIVDTMLAQELNKMSTKEREKHCEQLHGILDDDFVETPELIEGAIDQLQMELLMIPKKDAYVLAWHMNRSYVEERSFRLLFLRANKFDAKKAAARLVLFMEKKKELFGPETLVRSLLLKDLDEDDIETMKAGALQVLPKRDRAGRLILIDFHLIGPRVFKTDMNLVSGARVSYFLFLCNAALTFFFLISVERLYLPDYEHRRR